MPILANLLLETTRNGMRIAATDLEIGIQTHIPAQVDRSGSVTLPARLLTEIVNNLPASPVEIQVEEGTTRAQILCENSSFEILGLPATDFPSLTSTEAPALVKVNAALLRTMIRQTVFAVSTDETRLFLTGVHMVAEGDEMRLVTTDGGRLALRTARTGVHRPPDAPHRMAAIIPGRAMHEIARLLTGVDSEMAIGLTDKQVVISLGDAPRYGSLLMVSRLIQGQFPNYQQVIPQTFKQRIKVATEPLHAGLRRVAITARDSATVVHFATEGGILSLQSSTPEVGYAREEIAVASEGEVVPTAFNARYLMDPLSVIDADEVSLDLTGPLSPAVLRPVGSDNYVYILAPVHAYGEPATGPKRRPVAAAVAPPTIPTQGS
jgi:DNA polymerase-3 subunit beta